LIKSNPHLLVLSYNISYYLLRGFVYWCHGLVDHAVCGNHACQSSHHHNSCITLIPYFIFEMKQIFFMPRHETMTGIKHWFCPSICGSGHASETQPQCLAFWMPFCAWSPEFTVTCSVQQLWPLCQGSWWGHPLHPVTSSSSQVSFFQIN